MLQHTQNHTLEDIIENFAVFDDWEQRYSYLIDLGKNLAEMEDSLKTDANKVQGCVSQVWMVAEVEEGKFHFVADSDAHIVRGLIALLMYAYQGKTPEEVAAIDIKAVFSEIGLDQHLSPNRRNGFFAMVERLRKLAGGIEK